MKYSCSIESLIEKSIPWVTGQKVMVSFGSGSVALWFARQRPVRRKGEEVNAKLIGMIVLLALLVICAIQNYQPVTVKFLFWIYETSMVLVVLVSFLIGCLAGGLALEKRRRAVKTAVEEVAP